jgi:hypothetical protein
MPFLDLQKYLVCHLRLNFRKVQIYFASRANMKKTGLYRRNLLFGSQMAAQRRQINSTGQVVLFLTHIWSEPAFSRFTKMRDDLQGIADVYLLLDGSTGEVLGKWETALERNNADKKIFSFTLDSLWSLGYSTFRQNSLVPGSAHFPVLKFAEENFYTHYWLVEHDVLFTGDWGELLMKFTDQRQDLLCSHLVAYPNIPNWPWWRSLLVPKEIANEIDLQKKKFLKAFFPIYRISSAGIACVHKAHEKGWTGHYEVLVPNALSVADLLVGDFNSFGEYYSGGVIRSGQGGQVLSSLRWRPPIILSEIEEQNSQLIFHPVK